MQTLKIDLEVGKAWSFIPADDRSALVTSATAYAAGRMTYVTSTVSDMLLREWESMLPEDRLFVTSWLRSKASLGHDCDIRSWNKVLDLASGIAAPPQRFFPLSDTDIHIIAFCAARAWSDRHLPRAEGPSLDRVRKAFAALSPMMREQDKRSIAEEMLHACQIEIYKALIDAE